MTSPVDERIAWIEKNYKVKGSRPFRISTKPERKWQREFLRALEGFKSWPTNDDFDALCEDCKAVAETIVDHPDELEHTQTKEHLEGCCGLVAEPILFLLVAGNRRVGKTVIWFSAACEAATNEKNFEALYLASVGDQSNDLTRDNLALPIEASALLRRKWHVAPSQNKWTVPAKKSVLRVSAPTMKAVGKGVELLGIDEARQFPGQVLSVLLPLLQDTHGIKCMKCRTKIHAETDYKRSCPIEGCDGKMRRFYARAVIMSNAAIRKGDPEKDWWADVVNSLKEEGVGKHEMLFELDDSARYNPDLSEEAKNASVSLMRRSEGLRSFIASDFENRETRAGEDWLHDYEIDEAVNHAWKPTTLCSLPVVGFFDTSDVDHLSSIFMVEDHTDKTSRIRYEKLKVSDYLIWDPKDEGCEVTVRGTIDERLVEEALIEFLSCYPTLVYFGVDTRLRPWARRLVAKLQAEQPWGYKVNFFDGKDTERDIGWSELKTKITSGNLPLPPEPRLVEELKDARQVFKKGRAQVRETNKHTLHLDLAENLATICYLTYMLSQTAGSFREANPPSARVKKTMGAKVRRFSLGGGGRFRG